MEVKNAGWRKSSHSSNGGNTCVEMAPLGEGAGVRDSVNPGAGHLAISREVLAVMLTDIKSGRHDL